MLTIMRSIRDDFGIEIWRDLGYDGEPAIFAQTAIIVMCGVVLINGAAIWITSNRHAFLGSLGLVGFGFTVVLVVLVGHWQQWLPPLGFMVLTGVGLYIPYVAFRTTLFERLIAAFRERGNIGFLMYLADAVGYLGYVAIMLLRNTTVLQAGFLSLFVGASWLIAIASIFITLYLAIHPDPGQAQMIDAGRGRRPSVGCGIDCVGDRPMVRIIDQGVGRLGRDRVPDRSPDGLRAEALPGEDRAQLVWIAAARPVLRYPGAPACVHGSGRRPSRRRRRTGAGRSRTLHSTILTHRRPRVSGRGGPSDRPVGSVSVKKSLRARTCVAPSVMLTSSART